ncbi:DoxX family protein [Arthrobacter sp. KK5.5]|uniref:DoxX family protein n=1 Tax=Arthrobacter sp. KK5.5 TaxID=3373084 RepID=UPI003EE77B5E
MNTTPNQTTLTAAQTVLRVVIGLLFVAHGAQKYFEWTIAGTQGAFAQMGIPLASMTAPAVATLELVGGLLLVLGLFTRPVAALLVLNMLGAIFLVHVAAGVYVENGGYELVLAFGAGAAAIALLGAGRLSLDHVLFGRRRAAADQTVVAEKQKVDAGA